MKNMILCAKDVSKTFMQSGKETQILNNINVEFYEGDFTVVMGSSGAGKSTLLYVLSGMDGITGGSVTFKGQEISALSEKKMAHLRAEEFGFVFQQAHLVSHLTLFENVAVAGAAARPQTTTAVRAVPPAVPIQRQTVSKALLLMRIRKKKLITHRKQRNWLYGSETMGNRLLCTYMIMILPVRLPVM